MNVKPILFNTEMVRAILDGRKSCTRRIVKGFIPNNAVWGYTAFTPKGRISCRGTFADGYGEKFFKPPYQPGDILYIRETWCALPVNEAGHMRGHSVYYYKADRDLRPEGWRGNWHPSIHMPKEAARIWLKVTDVRVERLHDITYNGALRDGSEGIRCDHVALGVHGCTDCMNTGWIEPPQVEFMQIWDSTIKKPDLDQYGWDANPWVWVIEFERCDKPESEE
mgnify:CR=1 FL=1|jgi:hypothetical protein